MAEFPRQPLGAVGPTEGHHDELLADPPTDDPPTSLRAYGHGKVLRRAIYLTLGIGTLVAFFVGRWYVEKLRAEASSPTPEYATSEGAERPKVLYWSQGRARLGLQRGETGIEAIVLPDRVLRLPEDVEHAQVIVNVVDGHSTVKIVSGRINERMMPASAAQDQPATAQ